MEFGITQFRKNVVIRVVIHLGPVVQSPISANPGLTLNKTCGVNPGLALIGL